MIVVDPRFYAYRGDGRLFLWHTFYKEGTNYTNASFLVNEAFQCADEGLFSGFDAVNSDYDRTSWNYQPKSGAATPGHLPENVAADPTLQNPHCVFQLLR